MSRIEIIPAILPKDFSELEEKTSLLQGLVKTVQIDVCDGQFVPNATWPYRKHDDSFDRILKEEEGMPGWERLNFEFDLMINRPEEVVEDWIQAGASRIIIHAESKGDVEGAIKKVAEIVDVGIALNMETPLDEVRKYLGDIRFVQLMGIDNIGFQGQEFDDKVLERVKELKANDSNLPISVDGGVSLENAPKLIEAGASRLVVGSAIFHSENVFETIQRFKGL